jgi:hypothetical protein
MTVRGLFNRQGAVVLKAWNKDYEDEVDAVSDLPPWEHEETLLFIDACFIFRKDRRTLHDLFASTVVVKA